MHNPRSLQSAPILRRALPLGVGFCVLFALCLWPQIAWALDGSPHIFPQQAGPTEPFTLPAYWYLLMAALALLVPAGFILISVAGLDAAQAWHAALGGLAALGVACVSYWATGFGLQFGGIGLVYVLPELQGMVWEWSALPPAWGRDWGMAGLSGWFLSGAETTALVYALFLAHLPWAIVAAILPVVALRRRASSIATLILAGLIGGFIYPLAGNWVQGGGWLAALGRNLNLGHGLIDFGGAGTVHLVAGGFGLAALVVFVPRRARQPISDAQLPPAQLPLLAVVGGLLVMAGTMGWLWSNPLQIATLSDVALMRGSVNVILFAGGGALLPLLYTWLVTGQNDPLMSARGLAAGVVAGLAVGPFVSPGPAFLIGLLAGATVPFVTFVADHVLRLDDATGALHVSFVPALLGLLLAGIWADGTVGAGWQLVGVNDYLGVPGQGVSGIFVAGGMRADFPAQLQAQMVGILALGLWGFLTGMVICTPLSLFFYALTRSRESQRPAPVPPATDVDGLGFEPFQIEDRFTPLTPNDSVRDDDAARTPSRRLYSRE